MLAHQTPCIRKLRPLLTVLFAGATLMATGFDAFGRPSAMKLFPHDTLVFVRVANARETAEKLRSTSTGEMLVDPQLAPFVDRLYGGVADLYTDELQERLGISWEELQRLPQGEVAFGLVARSGTAPAVLLLVDQGGEASSARSLVDRAIEIGQERGGELSTEKIGEVDVTVIRDGSNQSRMFGMFELENTIVVATDANVLRGVLHHWNGDDGESGANVTNDAGRGDGEAATDDSTEYSPGLALAENYHFVSILRNCRRPHDPPPNVILWADPVNFAHETTHGNAGARFALSYLPALGIDGILGLGATLTFATGEYDDLTHFHVLLENPRAGLLQVIQFDQGETAPEDFVPRGVENYFTWNMNFPATYDRIIAMGDTIVGEGKLEDGIWRRISEPLGVDFAADIIDNLAGRATLIAGYEKPARWGSHKHVLAVSLVDEAHAEETLQAVIDRYPELFERRQFGAAHYYAIRRPDGKPLASEERPFDPFVAIMDGYLFLGTSTQIFEQCVTARDGVVERLVDSNDYARVVATLGRETGAATPAVFSMQRAEESLRHVYDLLTSEQSRGFLETNGANNAFFSALLDALDQNELPPFDVLQKYLGVSGGILYDTDTGYHGISFSLRNEAAQ